jgi:hypothetical protein
MPPGDNPIAVNKYNNKNNNNIKMDLEEVGRGCGD